MGDGEIAREAKRLFRTLRETGAHLARQPSGRFRLLSRGDNGKYQNAAVAEEIVEAFARRGWISVSAKAGSYVLNEAGIGWYARAMAGDDDPFAAQHQLRTRKQITDPRGIAQTVTVDEGESVLARLKQRGLIDAVQFDAGEKFRRDFTLAQLMPRLGVDLTAPMIGGRRGQAAPASMTDTVLAAKQRFARAMQAAGPGLSDLLFDVCCHLRGLEDAERAFGWPNRSGRVVLRIALDRLADHYGLRVTGKRRMRSWHKSPPSP